MYLISQTFIYLALALIIGGAIGYAWRACMADTACDGVREDLTLAQARYDDLVVSLKTPIAQPPTMPAFQVAPKAGLADMSGRELEAEILKAAPGRPLKTRFSADDLTIIKGITPRNDAWLVANGITRLSQIASLTAAELFWLVENLPQDGASVYRDQWVAQATLLEARNL